MPSHSHRNSSQPELDSINNIPVVDAEFVDTPPGSGFDDLDFTELERSIVLACHPKANDYVVKLIEVLRKSEVYKTVRRIAREKSNGNEELAVVTMFSLA